MHLVHVNNEGEEAAVVAIRLDPGTSTMPFFAQLPEMIPFVTGPGKSPDQEPNTNGRKRNRLADLFNLKPNTASEEQKKPDVVQDVQMDMGLVLDSVYRLNEFWTYKGSLTSPPCREGIRWFVARTIAFTAVDQMRAILGACTYSARAEQEVWLHEINSA